MNKFFQFLLVLFLGLLGMYIVNAILNFFNIPLEYYLTYLLFAICMVILYYIMPKKQGNIFN
jgi:heme A synthase